MQSLGFKVPVGLQRYGSIGSIAYEGQGVKLEGVKFIELETERASTKEESGLTSVLTVSYTHLTLPTTPYV